MGLPNLFTLSDEQIESGLQKKSVTQIWREFVIKSFEVFNPKRRYFILIDGLDEASSFGKFIFSHLRELPPNVSLLLTSFEGGVDADIFKISPVSNTFAIFEADSIASSILAKSNGMDFSSKQPLEILIIGAILVAFQPLSLQALADLAFEQVANVVDIICSRQNKLFFSLSGTVPSSVVVFSWKRAFNRYFYCSYCN